MNWLKVGLTILLTLSLVAGVDAITIKNRSYSEVFKNDPKDRIMYEIGDQFSGTSANNFRPILNISRWGEVYFTILPKNIWPGSGTVTMTINQTAGKITARRGNITINFYNYSIGRIEAPDGGFEYEIILANIPVNNTFQFTLNTKDLDVFYQPPLNEENKSCTSETNCGFKFRPENVVGSYAFYHKYAGGLNLVNGKDYKTGKAFHLYRPLVSDSGANKTWGVLNITGNNLNITIDSNWLKTAVYPVIIDPTFGYTKQAASADNLGVGNVYTNMNASGPASDGNLLSIYGYIGRSSTTPNFDVALYDGFTGIGTTLLYSNTSTMLPIAGPAWQYKNISGAITAGRSYWIAAGNSGDVGISVKYDSGWKMETGAPDPYPPFPDPWLTADNTSWNVRYSFYAEYTTGGAPAGTIYDATFSFSPLASVRNGTITLTNKSAGSVIWFGNGSVPCLSESLTPNVQIFIKNFSFCNICLTVKDGDGANANTSCKFGKDGPYILQPWAWF